MSTDLTLDTNVREDERIVIDGLSLGRPIDELADQVGWTRAKGRKFVSNATVLATLAARCLRRVHGTMIPRSLVTLQDMVEDNLHVVDSSGQRTKVPVKPETRLAAINTVLKVGGWDRATETLAKRPGEGKAVAEMSLGELREQIDAIEAELAAKAKPVGDDEPAFADGDGPGCGPVDVLDGEVIQDLPSNYSVLD